ncbi:hypothetical protein OOU_Y34scaffold01019g7 [Pyricularia oryzae Y34]|uniref:Uncharacterized protein n=1 Tax=Pyricularia oryzae (strain Y34) TaxID=1143189 RepID=A0AA97PFP0_PYRO3|nr:hypothetical protein OOU_Y34scaffold01019g7 [Pyricularia oryzae Y34]
MSAGVGLITFADFVKLIKTHGHIHGAKGWFFLLPAKLVNNIGGFFVLLLNRNLYFDILMPRIKIETLIKDHYYGGRGYLLNNVTTSMYLTKSLFKVLAKLEITANLTQ